MSKLDRQFEEDRALRDTARKVLMADIEHAKAALTGKAIAGRVGNRVGDGAKDILEVAKGHADDKRGILAVILGAVVLWFAKSPIMEILGFHSSTQQDESDNQPGGDEHDLEQVDDEAPSIDADETAPSSALASEQNNLETVNNHE